MSERARLEDLARQRGPYGALEVAADDLEKCRAAVEVLRGRLAWALRFVRMPDAFASGGLEAWARDYNAACAVVWGRGETDGEKKELDKRPMT